MGTYTSRVRDASDFGPSGFTPCTDKQIGFYTRLCAERGVDVSALVESGKVDFNKISKTEMSTAISAVMEIPKIAAPAKTAPEELEDGMYRVSLDNGPELKIYKVQHAVHGSGRQYAKILTQYSDDTWGFEYAQGIVYKLRPEHKMTAEDAASFGELYGICVNCARTLTREDSIRHGYGPTCASNNGWPYQVTTGKSRKA